MKKSLKNRKPVMISIVFILLTFSLAACSKPDSGNDPTASKGKVEIQFWNSFTGDGATWLENTVNKFNESQDEITVKTLSNQDSQKQLTAISGGGAPDLVVTVWNNVGPWSEAGAIKPLNDLIKQTGYDTSAIIPAAMDRMTVGDTIYALPIQMSMGSKLLYNKKMLADAGISAPPETVEQLFEDAKKLTKKDDKGNLTQIGFIPDYPWIDNVFWPIIFGGSWDDGNGKLTANQQANVDSINYQASFHKEFGDDAIAKLKSGMGDWESPQDPILTGKLAMVIGWDSWWSNERGEGDDKPLGIAPFPYPEAHPELKNSGMVSPISMFIPNKAKHPEEAFKLMQYLTSEDAQVEYSTMTKQIPILLKALDDPRLTKNEDLKAVWQFYESAKSPNLKGFPNSIYINQYLQALTEQTEKVLKGQISGQEAMDNVVKQIQPLADKK